jgi:hypothetical protein
MEHTDALIDAIAQALIAEAKTTPRGIDAGAAYYDAARIVREVARSFV